MHSQMPGVCPGGMLKPRFDQYITSILPSLLVAVSIVKV